MGRRDPRVAQGRRRVISLTDVPDQVFLVPCDRNGSRYLALRDDYSDNREAVLFVADDSRGPSMVIQSMVDTAVVLRRDSVAALAHFLLDTALKLDDNDEDDEDDGLGFDPEQNGHST